MKQSAKVILHHRSPTNKEIKTIEVTTQRFIVEEVLKHRQHSHSQTSGRAIPIGKMNQSIIENCAKPEYYTKHQAGMTGAKFEGGYPKIGVAQRTPDEIYQDLANISCMYADQMFQAGYSKESSNRLTQSFQWATCVITTTEWDNFFKQRLAGDTDPTVKRLAERMWDAVDKSIASDMPYGNWHLPYIRDDEMDEMRQGTISVDDLRLASAARIARTSYNNHDGTLATIAKDIVLAKDTLIAKGHLVPLEHQAFPVRPVDMDFVAGVNPLNGIVVLRNKIMETPLDSLRGWCSQRAMLRINDGWEV